MTRQELINLLTQHLNPINHLYLNLKNFGLNPDVIDEILRKNENFIALGNQIPDIIDAVAQLNDEDFDQPLIMLLMAFEEYIVLRSENEAGRKIHEVCNALKPQERDGGHQYTSQGKYAMLLHALFNLPENTRHNVLVLDDNSNVIRSCERLNTDEGKAEVAGNINWQNINLLGARVEIQSSEQTEEFYRNLFQERFNDQNETPVFLLDFDGTCVDRAGNFNTALLDALQTFKENHPNLKIIPFTAYIPAQNLYMHKTDKKDVTRARIVAELEKRGIIDANTPVIITGSHKVEGRQIPFGAYFRNFVSKVEKAGLGKKKEDGKLLQAQDYQNYLGHSAYTMAGNSLEQKLKSLHNVINDLEKLEAKENIEEAERLSPTLRAEHTAMINGHNDCYEVEAHALIAQRAIREKMATLPTSTKDTVLNALLILTGIITLVVGCVLLGKAIYDNITSGTAWASPPVMLFSKRKMLAKDALKTFVEATPKFPSKKREDTQLLLKGNH